MTVLLATGLTGFVGTRCTQELIERGFEIHGLSSREPKDLVPGVCWHRFDLLNDDGLGALCSAIRPQVLLHLAWFAEPPAFWTSPLNAEWLRASMLLVDAFVSSGGARIVVAGSCAEYSSPAHGQYVETGAIEPETTYGKAKAALHEYLATVKRGGDLTYAWGRLFFVYGPGEPENKFVSSTARELRAGRIPKIREPDRLVDYIHVHDAARALVAMIDSPVQGAINVGTGQPVAVGELASMINETLRGARAPVRDVHHRAVSGNDMVANVMRLRDELNFKWEFDLPDGLRDELGTVP